ncbi:MAG TPA: helix-turn-helix domain-containing protein [Pseudobdellovibrionaceae bacterium]|nr:helix-turn-helix domain-containing protein [Pseudobdellovibrionaceae bacterium]
MSTPQTDASLTPQLRRLFICESSLAQISKHSVEADCWSSFLSDFSPTSINLQAAFQEPEADEATAASENRGENLAAQLKGNLILVHDSQLTGAWLNRLDRTAQLIWLAIVPLEITENRARFLFEFGASDLIPELLDRNFGGGLLRAKIGHWLSQAQPLDRGESVQDLAIEQDLTRKEVQMYDFLRRAGKEGLEKTELVSMLWPKQKVSEKSLDVHLFNLRRKLVGTPNRILCRNRRIFLEVEPTRPKSS